MTGRSGVVLVAGRGESSRLVFHALRASVGVDRVIVERAVGAKQLLRRRIAKLGMRTVAGQILFKLLVDKPLRARSRRRVAQIKREFGLCDEPISEPDIVHVDSINSAEAIQQLQRLNARVIVVNGTRIIAKNVLESVPAPFINMHAGITPRYRGVHGGYWALAEGDPEHCGVTVHLVDPGIDTGGIVAQAAIKPTAADNFVTYPVLQIGVGLPLLVQAVRAALDGTLRSKPGPGGPSRLRSHPTLVEYLRTRLQNGTR
jgi:methionyl-tRNA formyltransferase